jgi:hypothetical protein
MALGCVAQRIRAFRADRKKHFHAFHSAAYGWPALRLFNLDLLRVGIAALQRANCAGQG